MAQFPLNRAAISDLAEAMIAGFAANTTTYPSPPVSPAALEGFKSDYITAQEAMTQAHAVYMQSVVAKDAALQTLTDHMKADLRYAENTVQGDDSTLQLVGWGGRRTRQALQAPGQCGQLEAPREGAGWVYLEWMQPRTGGAVAAYEIQRRARAGGPWQEVALSMDCTLTLHDQPRSKEWEYRVLAVNKAGKGTPSNTVMAVL